MTAFSDFAPKLVCGKPWGDNCLRLKSTAQNNNPWSRVSNSAQLSVVEPLAQTLLGPLTRRAQRTISGVELLDVASGFDLPGRFGGYGFDPVPRRPVSPPAPATGTRAVRRSP